MTGGWQAQFEPQGSEWDVCRVIRSGDVVLKLGDAALAFRKAPITYAVQAPASSRMH